MIDYSVIIVCLLLSTLTLYCVSWFFKKRGYLDRINLRSSHSVNAYRSGGLSIFITIFLISFFYYLQGNEIYDFSILVPLLLLLSIGLYDDIYNLDFKLKFIFQIIAAKLIIDNGLLVDNLHGFFGFYEINRVFAQLLTIFLITAIINSINFIDGIDGLAITIVISFIIFFEFFSIKTSPFYNFNLLLIFCLLPMFYFNFKKKNKIFLGDSGSHLLGGVVGIYIIYILTNDYIIKEEFDLNKIIFIFSILTYPIIDIVRVFFVRILNKKSPFQPDQNHIHHLFLNKFKSHLLVTAIILSLSIVIMIVIQQLF